MQTGDCRMQTGYKMHIRYKMQTADCWLGIKMCRPKGQEPAGKQILLEIRDSQNLAKLGLGGKPSLLVL